MQYEHLHGQHRENPSISHPFQDHGGYEVKEFPSFILSPKVTGASGDSGNSGGGGGQEGKGRYLTLFKLTWLGF